jgi:ABC-type oligopeptide transport system substrate-binding subunit
LLPAVILAWCAAVWSLAQAAKAAAALLKWKAAQKPTDGKAQLFEDATDDFTLQVTLRKMPEKKRLKPVMLYGHFPHMPWSYGKQLFLAGH